MKLYTTTEIAEFCKVSKQTVRKWIEEGDLKAVKKGDRFIRILEDDFKKFLER